MSIGIDQLVERYEVFLLDAFGVLLHTDGPMPGAVRFLERLSDANRRAVVITNDASRLPETASARYRSLGLGIGDGDVLTSGMLLPDAFERLDLVGQPCLALGTRDSEEYVRRAGGVIAPCSDDGEYAAVIICDDDGYPFLRSMDSAITALFRLFDAGKTPALILPNPDIIYPRGESAFGFTAGGAALLIETALARRYPDRAPRFIRLGKPEPTLYRAALERAGSGRAVVIGDQLETDIAGAVAAGIDSVLVEAGVSGCATGVAPTYRIKGLE